MTLAYDGPGPAILFLMTKVQIRFRLQRPLDDNLMAQITEAHSIYGMLRIGIDPSVMGITVEYDASRLTPLEVEAALTSKGIPVMKEA